GLFVTGDRASLQRLVSTLCDNAAKYAPEGGKISAEAFPEGRNAVLKGMNLEEGATAVERNGQVGGHHA
ncbi:MAG: ATP-binding protein, partial [Clostridia bacterium]|nr:ATP-binding protein [Clostridia bacterium]